MSTRAVNLRYMVSESRITSNKKVDIEGVELSLASHILMLFYHKEVDHERY